MNIRFLTNNQTLIMFTSTSLGDRLIFCLGSGGKCCAAAFSSTPVISAESGGRAKSRPF
jgi:hypothetical protein